MCRRDFGCDEQVVVTMALEEAGYRLVEELPFNSASSAYTLDLLNSCRFSTMPFASIRAEYTAEEEKQG